jgi:hypothetical protein
MSILKRLEEKIEQTIDRVMRKNRIPPEPMEVVRLIVQEIERHIAPLGQGRHVFPHSVIDVQLYAADEERRSLYGLVLIEDRELADAIRESLKPPQCETPKGLDIRVKIVGPEPPAWANRGFNIEYKTRRGRGTRSKPLAVLNVIIGEANVPKYNITKAITRIGRLANIYGKDGLPIRHNDLAFNDNQNQINQSVSRRQAHIKFNQETGEYWLHDDTNQFGTVVIRGNGRRIEVSNNPGVKLESGDEIYFGQACVEFRMGE